MSITTFNQKILEGVALLPQGVSEPFYYFMQAEKRLFWPFLLSSFALALLALYLRRGRWSPRWFYRSFFSRRYWFNRSSATDVFYLFLNSLVRVLVLVPLLGSKLFATILVARFFQATFDTPTEFALPAPAVIVLYTVSYFLLEDFSRFLLHLALHKVPWLWYFHKTHHSATTLTPFTLHRVHPVEMILYSLRGLVIFGLVSGFFVYLFGNKVGSLEILGVGAFGFVFNMMGANLRHSHIWLGFGFLEKWLISPAQHQLHHSNNPAHRDINLGTSLAVWDRLLGTWRISGKRPARLRFGLTQAGGS